MKKIVFILSHVGNYFTRFYLFTILLNNGTATIGKNTPDKNSIGNIRVIIIIDAVSCSLDIDDINAVDGKTGYNLEHLLTDTISLYAFRKFFEDLKERIYDQCLERYKNTERLEKMRELLL